jgi:hypothetical protein
MQNKFYADALGSWLKYYAVVTSLLKVLKITSNLLRCMRPQIARCFT